MTPTDTETHEIARDTIARALQTAFPNNSDWQEWIEMAEFILTSLSKSGIGIVAR